MALLEVGTNKPYSTIQAAINDTAPSGHIRVNPGGVGNVYTEKLAIVSKRVRLSGSGVTAAGPQILVQSPDNVAALTVSGTGGVWCENLGFRTTLAAATYVCEGNVAEDWFSRCVVDGEAKGSKGLQAQFGDNNLIMRCTSGVEPSCGGQTLFYHFTCVKCTVRGIVSNANGGEFVGCLTADCNNAGFVNGNPQYCHNCVADDATPATFPGSIDSMALADIAFLDFAGNDFRLLTTTQAYFLGMAIVPYDLLGNRRTRETVPSPLVVAGCLDCLPAGPGFLSGSSQIRSM